MAAAGSVSGSVSGPASAVRYEKTDGTQIALMAALKTREKKMRRSLRLANQEGLT